MDYVSSCDCFMKAFRNLVFTKLRRNFLMACVDKKVIPRGLQVAMNLAFKTDNRELISSIQTALNIASSDILLAILRTTEEEILRLENVVSTYRMNMLTAFGEAQTSRAIASMKRALDARLISRREKLNLKLDRLISSTTCPVANTVPVGSLKITARIFTRCTDHSHPIPRPHRKHRHKNRQKTERKRHPKQPQMQLDQSALDPIVLAPNVLLTEDQKAVTRLSNKFAPTPRTPMDICDLAIGLEQFAEHLRWHQFHEKKRLEDPATSGIVHEAFDKPPWYQPTERAAPRGDEALEAFISAIRTQALDLSNRRRTRDNLSPGQRRAIMELRNLPMSHQAACRSADKSSVTVITSLEDEDQKILEALHDPEHYVLHPGNPNDKVVAKVKNWVNKWEKKGVVSPAIATFAANIDDSQPGKCKPLVKTHKPKPYPYRLLLSGCGTPVEPLSKIVQKAICHLTEELPHQVIDTKEFLTKIETINKELAPLPVTATIAVCDVISLYPNVDNAMGVPTVDSLLSQFPTRIDLSKRCILEALNITLENNFTQYTDASQSVIFAKPSRGTAMGPSHACDFVDVFMSQLDRKLMDTSSVRFLTSLLPPERVDRFRHLDWSRFRDDGIAILPDSADVPQLEKDLSRLHPPNIRWVVSHGTEAQYLDLKLKLENGYITTDVFSKSNHCYLPPSSCHSPSTFKGLISSVGTRLRLLCNDDKKLEERLNEYAGYFALSGWNREYAKKELIRGASKDRKDILQKPRLKNPKKIAWLSTYDPRLPSKTKIIRNNLHILYSNPKNHQIFPDGLIISADRRRRNLGEIIQPTVPNRFPLFGPREKPGFHPCYACDTCRHSIETDSFKSPWDGRFWKIRQAIHCTTPNVVYCLRCMDHPDELYIGSTVNLRHRWANHKSDCKLGKGHKCQMAQHFITKQHTPTDPQFNCLQIFAIEAVHSPKNLGRRETWWQMNVGTIFVGLNSRSDMRSILSQRLSA